MEPILVPAWPSVLRAGLPCITPKGPTIYIAAGPMLIGVIPSAWSAPSLLSAYTTEDLVWLRPDEWRLDFRDPAVRDAVVRAMWRKLRPEEPEPLTAPLFACSYGAGMVPDEDDDFADRLCWYLGPDGAACMFVDAEQCAPSAWTAPGLERIGRECGPDRDLLALAACAASVLGGA